MELHQLRYVAAVARTGNFSRAAVECNVSQPSLSQQIQKLEDELGERLFDRMKKHTKLTSSGSAFLYRALKILEDVDMAKKEAKDATELLCGTLNIGVLPTIAPHLLPEAMAKFIKRFPGVEIIVHEDTTARLLNLAVACEIDIALASCPMRDERLEVDHLFTEELLLALPPGHPLTRKKTLRVSDLDGERLIVMKEGHCLGDQVLSFCDRRDLRPTLSFRSAQLETIQSLVAAGLGISLVPAMAAPRGGLPKPEYRSLPEPRPNRKIIAIWPKQRALGRAATEFLNAIRDDAKGKFRSKKIERHVTVETDG